jgi:[glutamine synthetase] adenylyltransferase / [glutamine synthetase]-adenylyl-L-tyrosine phosphorylase
MIDDRHNFSTLIEFLDEEKAQSTLKAYGFSDWKTAWTILKRMGARNTQGLAEIWPFLLAALTSSADPDRSLVNFERFMEVYGPELFHELQQNPRVIEILATLFSASPFLTEILLRTPNALWLLNNRQALTERKTIEQFQAEALLAARAFGTDGEKLDALRSYQRSQYLRIGSNDFLGLYDLRAVFSQLSRMAIGLVRAGLALSARQTGTVPGDFVILAMGKLGGWELNYSSDIDLLFVARKDAGKFIPLAMKLIENITRTTSEGFLYRVDLRLRPWGNDGPLITTMDGYLEYIQKNARLWEKQAFFKARPIAGNLAFGEELRNEIEPYLFGTPADEVRSAIFSMKQRTEEFLQEKGRHWGEIKLGEGSIRDIEFVVQSLQMIHPSVRTRATLKAILHLREQGFLNPMDAHILTDGYIFLRTIEHSLQIIDYRQKYTLPSDPSAIALLARRLGFEGPNAGDQFIERYEQHCHAIRSIFLRIVGNEPAKNIGALPQVSPQLLQHIARMDASYSAIFSRDEIQQHALLASRIDNQTVSIVDTLALETGKWRVTVVGLDYLGELSLICGLLFVYGLDIIDSRVFTYEPMETNIPTARIQNTRRKIVDVFTVRSVGTQAPSSEMWARYADELLALLKEVQAGRRRKAQGDLAKRVGQAFQEMTGDVSTLYPIDIEIDNDSSEIYTILKIGTPDTVGFLYEFSNALALNHVNIARMFVQSIGNRVHDTIYVTDEKGHKIISPEKQRELRAATVLIKHFTHLLPHSPNPETALLHFREFLRQLFERPNWPDELAKLEQPEVLDALAKLLGVSNFLWDDFLRMQYTNLFPVVRDVDALVTAKDHQQLQAELELEINQSNDWRSGLNAFKDREMFRIDMRHILGYTPEFWDFAHGLTDLAEVIISAVFSRCSDDMHRLYGEPRLQSGLPCSATICALGKCGGRELGFASDIELMLIYSGIGETTGPKSISTSDYFEELIHAFINSIQARQEGIFHIDLQLRPYGKAGRLAVSLDAFQRYFDPLGPAWAYERQALIRLRPIAGDQVLGGQICSLRDRFVYNGEPFNVTAMRAMRERQIRHHVSARTFNAKYSPGGLVDLEYLVQGLQITYGATNPSLRSPNIRMSMSALADVGILSIDNFTRLRRAHTFLHWLIDSLRVVRGNSRDVNLPPFDSEEFAFLARRLQYGSDTNRLQEDLTRYPLDVQELNAHLLPNP